MYEAESSLKWFTYKKFKIDIQILTTLTPLSITEIEDVTEKVVT